MQLFFIVVFVYILVGRTVWDGDNLPARYLPLSILHEFDFDLDEFTFLYDTRMPHALRQSGAHIVSTYPPWAAVLALPLYFLPVVGGISPRSPLIPDLERLSGTLITAFSVVILYAALKRMTADKIAWFIALIYAFGTSSLSTSSQAQWQHGPTQLFLALTVYCLVRGAYEAKFSVYAGFTLASAIICRPVNVLIALPVGAYILHKQRGQLLGFLCASCPPLLLFMVYNASYFGSAFTTGFASGVYSPSLLWASSGLFGMPLWEGLMGVLVSPGRGLLIYSPILVFAFVGIAAVWMKPENPLLRYLSLAPLPLIYITAKWVMWWGGWSYGPRLLVDITPILCLFLYLPFQWAEANALLKSALVGLSAVSIGLHAVGAFGDGSWNGIPTDIDRRPERLWSWRESPPIYYGKQALTDVKQGFFTAKRLILALPTSRGAPHKLLASYHLIKLVPGLEVFPPEPLILQMAAVNTGQAVWLAHVWDGRGQVRLGWRWLQGAEEVPSTWGRMALKYDIFPGEDYIFTATIVPPKDPGNYILEADLVSDHVTWFSEQGTSPLKMAVHVANPSGVEFESWLANADQSGDPSLALAIATDQRRYRPSDILGLNLDVATSNGTRLVDVYLGLVGPNKILYRWDGEGLSPQNGSWSPQAKGVELPEGMRVTHHRLLDLGLGGMPHGLYTWYLVLTEPDTQNVLATAKATFALQP